MEKRMDMQYIDIDKIKPNPLNPRIDDSTSSEEMEKILSSNGFETGITCYYERSSDEYIIISGHRRRYAAEKLEFKTIPVFIIDKPKTKLEELEQIGSSQRGQKDWSSYEWAKYTVELWSLKGKCKYKEISHITGTSESHVARQIKVFRSYPHNEIQERMMNGSFSISLLDDILGYLEKINRIHPHIIDELSESYIRNQLLYKVEKEYIHNTELRSNRLIELGDTELIIKFFRNTRMKIADAYKEMDQSSDIQDSKNKIQSTLKQLNKRSIQVFQMDANTPEEAKFFYELLESIEQQIKSQMKKLNRLTN